MVDTKESHESAELEKPNALSRLGKGLSDVGFLGYCGAPAGWAASDVRA